MPTGSEISLIPNQTVQLGFNKLGHSIKLYVSRLHNDSKS